MLVGRGSGWMGRLRWLACCAGLLALAAAARAQGPQLTVRLDPPRVAVGDEAVLTVTLEGFSQRVGKPQVPDVAGVDIYEGGRSTNMSWVNGRFSSSIVYTFILRPRSAGSFTIGPVQVEDKDTAHSSETVTLTAIAGGAGGAGGAPSAPGGAVREESRAADVSGLFARVVADKREAYLDEQVTVRFRLYQRADVPLLDIAGFEPPVTEGFWREDLGSQRDYTVTIEGQTYHVREIAWALFATRTGELEIGPGRIVCQIPANLRGRHSPFDSFFGRGLVDQQSVPLTTEPLRIQVRGLPEAGRPASFSGSVGDYTLQAQVDEPRVRQGEPFTLTATVRGDGHVQTIGAPVWPGWNGLRVYDSGEAVNASQVEDRITGEKAFKQVLIANRAGTIALEPIRFAYFDPHKQRYMETASAPLSIQVEPAAPGSGGGLGEDVVAVGDDIRYIQTGIAPQLHSASAGARSARYLPHALPLLALCAAYYARRRRLAWENDPVRSARRGAHRRAHEALRALSAQAGAAEIAAGLHGILEAYLDAWLGAPVRGMRRSELERALGEAGLAAPQIERVIECFEWSDEVRLGAGALAGGVTERVASIGDLLDELEAQRTAERGRGR
jgi:hypothetical protein